MSFVDVEGSRSSDFFVDSGNAVWYTGSFSIMHGLTLSRSLFSSLVALSSEGMTRLNVALYPIAFNLNRSFNIMLLLLH